MRRWVLLLAAAAAVTAAPALAADPTQLSCPRDQLSEAQRGALDTAARGMVEMSDPRIVGLTEALAECARRHEWSANTSEMARRYHLSLALRSGTRPALIAGGLNPDPVERAIIADEVLIGELRRAPTGGIVTKIYQRHRALIMRTIGNRESLVQAFGAYLGAVGLLEASRRGFIAD